MTAIPFPTETSILTELNTAIATYPETNVQLELVEVELDDNEQTLNVSEGGRYRVQITNNGDMNLADVTLKIKGLNGAQVKTGSAADFEYRDELISAPIEKVNGDGGSELVPPWGQSKYVFKAPSSDSDGEVLNLFKVTLEGWNLTWDRVLNAHTDPLATVNVTYANEVVAD